MIEVKLSTQIRICSCCGAKNIKRTFHVHTDHQEIFIGRLCLQKWLNINTSGNPHRVIPKIISYLKNNKHIRLDVDFD